MTPRAGRRAAVGLLFAWALLCFAGMALTVRGMKGAVQTAFVLRSAGVSQNTETRLQELLGRHTQNLGDLAGRVARVPFEDERDFEDRVVEIFNAGPLFIALRFIGTDYVRRWGFPFAENRAWRGTDLRDRPDTLAAARRAVETRRTVASGPLAGGEEVSLYAPVLGDFGWGGLMEGALSLSRLAHAHIGPLIGPRFHFELIDEQRGEELYSTMTPEDRGTTPVHDAYFTLTVADRTWWVVLHPTAPPTALPWVVAALLLELGAGGLIFYLAWRRTCA